MKKCRVILLAAVLIMLQAACARVGQPVPEGVPGMPEEAANGEKRVTVLIDSPAASIQKMCDDIERDLHIKTEVQTRANGSLGETMIKARIATGDMTDIFLFNTGALLYSLNPAENMLDLSNEPFCTYIPEDFKASATVDGKIYAVPTSNSNIAVVWGYNRGIYKDLGLAVPDTWESLMENCEKIEQAGITPVLGSFKDEWTCQLIFLGDEFNIEASVPDFPAELMANRAGYSTTPAALRSFEKMEDVSKYLNNNALSTTTSEAIGMLADGGGAHYPIMSIMMGQISRLPEEKKDNIGIFFQPGDDPDIQGMTIWLPNGWYIFKGSPRAELAKQWLAYHMEYNINAQRAAPSPDAPYAVKQLSELMGTCKTSLALEYESPLKGQDCIKLCLELLTGITDSKSAAIAYDKAIEKQAVQLNLPGW